MAKTARFVTSLHFLVLYRHSRAFAATILASLALLVSAHAQECYSGSEIDGATRTSLEAAAQQFLNLSAQGDLATLKTNALPDVAGNFSGIEQAVVNNKALFAQDQLSETRVFVLDASNSKSTWQRADFYCGIYNSASRVGISIPNLPPARYALVIAKLTGKEPLTLTLILKDTGRNSWKLAGYYVRRNTISDHDGEWFVTKARAYKEKGQLHNAWLYYLIAWELLAPVDFISTPPLDKLNDEIQASRPPDMPGTSAPLELTVGGKPVKVTELAAVTLGADMDLRLEYESSTASNPVMAAQENAGAMKALLTKYPEFREAFASVIVRARDGLGHEYATITAMKDVK